MDLELKNVTKSYFKKKILSSFSYKFENNGIYAIIGNSGSGKTTLLRIIAGLDKDYTGTVIGGGLENVSFAFQEYRLFPNLTAIENIVYAVSDVYDTEVANKAKELLIRLNFNGNDTSLYPNELSGGMKQRISFVRALIKNCPVLLLDEITKETDNTISKAMLDIIIEESKNRLIIFVSHKKEEIEYLKAKTINI